MSISNKSKKVMATVMFAAMGCTASVQAFASDKGETDQCPSYLVNFWKNFAVSMDNPDSVPEFLVRNECMRTVVSKAFHEAMQKRFDEPEKQEHVESLFAQLDWTDGYTY